MSLKKDKVMINPVIEAMNNRQSIRSYKPKPISKDVINTIIEAVIKPLQGGGRRKERKNFFFSLGGLLLSWTHGSSKNSFTPRFHFGKI